MLVVDEAIEEVVGSVPTVREEEALRRRAAFALAQLSRLWSVSRQYTQPLLRVMRSLSASVSFVNVFWGEFPLGLRLVNLFGFVAEEDGFPPLLWVFFFFLEAEPFRFAI